MDEDDEVPTASLSVWIGLIIIAMVSFWSQATVTEERFVPALNVVADYFNIPDDIAGATLMAAGASSPELFSSIVALFITHSALGLGTIVGSEIFNQLCICAGAVFASQTGSLKLDRNVVTREVFFYALGIFLLWFALRDIRPALDDDDTGGDHIYISFADSCYIFAGYILYVIVCAQFEQIVGLCEKCGLCCRRPAGASADSGGDREQKINTYGTAGVGKYSTSTVIDVPMDMPFLHHENIKHKIRNEPAQNFAYKTEEYLITKYGESRERGSSIRSNSSVFSGFDTLSQSLRKFSDGASLRKFNFLVSTEKPSDEHAMHDLEVNNFEERVSCFMWQRSLFYSHARVAKHAWHLRWFSLITNEGIHSVPDRTNFAKYKLKYPKFTQFEIDEGRCIIRVICKKRDFMWMAPSKEILHAVAKKLDEIIEWQQKHAPSTEEGEGGLGEGGTSSTTTQDSGAGVTASVVEDDDDAMFKDSDPSESLLDFPENGQFTSFFFFFVLYPLRFIMHWTCPDVRVLDVEGNPTKKITTAFLACFSCLVWLIVGSYAMVASLEKLAELLDIPDAVIGVTVSAVGTSLPNYVASKVAAENGFGNMAVSNAFGSNTFNIMIGLGLPWVLYTSFGTHFEPYHGLKNEGIAESVVILSVVLLIFILLVIPSGFVLYKWHGILFIILYIAYLVFAIGQVYW